jgi:hypothetical protein
MSNFVQRNPSLAVGRCLLLKKWPNSCPTVLRPGAVRWAMLCSLIATAKLNGDEPYAYLKDVLERL